MFQVKKSLIESTAAPHVKQITKGSVFGSKQI